MRLLTRDPVVAAVVGIAVVYGLLALLVPHPYPSFDEAKYLAIGQNALAGRGPQTAFGANFLPHSPFWPMLFAAPKAALNLDPWGWGYLLNAVAGMAVLLLAARFSARFGRLSMLLTVAVLVGWLDMFGLTRTARLDVPEAALTLAYLAVATSAIETGLVRRGILAGVLFAWAFLTKEASLVLLAAPFITGIALRRPIAHLARVAGLVLLVTLPLVSWWFAWYADVAGKVFALGLGRSLLLPVAAAIVLLALLMLVMALDRPPIARLRAALDGRLADRRVAFAVAAILSAAWIIAFLFAFSRSEVQAGRPLLDVPNLLRWARTWASDLVPIAVAALGAIAGLVMLARNDDRPAELLVTVVVAAPWLLLVAVQGEPPRNDIAVFAMLVAAGAGGWLAIADALRGRDRVLIATGALLGAAIMLIIDLQLARAGVAASITHGLRGIGGSIAVGAALGAAGTSAPARTWIRTRVASVRPTAPATLDLRAVAIALVAVLSVGMLGGASAWIAKATPNTARSYLATSVATWLETNLPAGSTVMFGAVQANETAIVLGGTFRLRSLQATIGVTSPTAPLGVTVGGSPVADLVVMDRHPRQDGYFVFTASRIERSLRLAQPAAIVYVTGLDTATPSMVNWLATAPGISLATTIDSPPGVTPLVARIYRVDMTSLAVPADRTFASSAAVDALLDALGGNARSGAIATALLNRIVMTDPGSAADAAMARLRSLAGG